jgi:hypothetical protein
MCLRFQIGRVLRLVSQELQESSLVDRFTCFRQTRCPGGLTSVASIATCYRLGGLDTESRCGRDFPHTSRLALGTTQTPGKCIPCLFPLGVRGQGVTLHIHSHRIRRTPSQLLSLQHIPAQHDMLPQHLVCENELNCEYFNITLARNNKAP